LNEWITRFDGVVMKTKYLPILFSMLVCAAWAVCSPSANADLYTQLSDFDMDNSQSQGGTPLGGTLRTNVKAVSGPAAMGVAYSNQYTSNAGPAIGEKVRVVAANELTTVGFSNNTSVGVDVGPNQKLVAVFAGEATVQPGMNPNEVIAQFSPGGGNIGGQLGIFLSPKDESNLTGLFSQTDPTSWGVSADNLVGRYTLKPQEAVFQGHDDAFDIVRDPDQTNAFAVNTLTPAQLQGTVLFRDVIDPLFTNLTSDPNGVPFADEGLIALVDENAVDNLPIDQAALDELNAIAELLGQPMNVGGEAFASGVGNASAEQFDAGALLANGDLTTTLDFTFVPARQTPIPEPASIAMWTLLFGIAAGYFWRSRRKYR